MSSTLQIHKSSYPQILKKYENNKFNKGRIPEEGDGL